ncbi:MAG: NAD(P)H-quinone oxidoreductase subunit 5 [Gloeomargarita sp. SKYG116]|nr:NAD(P)H-quinone oxidoreductase subunit 5 [Gloeomargarita sp. SKYG116]MDW8401701.1 NAD(P)H-quinone oxidoreductase subunit 5 [Gloeomargarita sp. SKYGB_i_bin116]
MEELLYQYAWLIPVLPLLGATVVGTGLITFGEWTSRLKRVNAALVLTLMGIALGHSLALLWSQAQGHPPYYWSFTWAVAGPFHLDMGMVIDRLSSLMLVIVTTVALLVMLYSDGYMAHDKGYSRFFAYLSLFGASMLGLVISPNLVQIYVFWELVGMCSYLLIGFWYDRIAAREAAQKAFIVNRVGDFGLLLGILGFYWTTGEIEFERLAERVGDLLTTGALPLWAATGLGILVFLGPVAKSAQAPLHVWLPDAMEGPTPISALIHAATMVAAGVFLLARMMPVYEHLPGTLQVVAWTGAFTAFLGATIALVQTDIKKGLAYSTISQLGYMVMAMGVAAPAAGMFHLMTHAYFKAMLFLGSGSVIHAMEAVVGHDPDKAQDMRNMGGLRKYMPITAATFLIGTLAICGIPPFAGFWSKDEILHVVFAANPGLWLVGWLTAGMTAFYMFRIYLLTFGGEFRGLAFGPGAMQVEELAHMETHGHAAEPHESPWTMTLPLVLLAIPSVAVGWVGLPFANYFEHFLEEPASVLTVGADWAHFDWGEFLVMAGSSVGVGLIGITLAFVVYGGKYTGVEPLAERLPKLYEFLVNKWYWDDLYEQYFALPLRRLARQALETDYRIIDGLVNLTGLVTLVTGEVLKYVNNGRVQTYALVILLAVLGLVLVSGWFS